MIQITPHMRILVAVEPIDFRAGIDGLANNCTKLLQADPFSGTLFVFGNRARTALKVLVCVPPAGMHKQPISSSHPRLTRCNMQKNRVTLLAFEAENRYLRWHGQAAQLSPPPHHPR
jgi:hypothetical protein